MKHQGKHINHDNHHNEPKTRTHIFRKLPDDGDPWAPNNLLKIRSKRQTSIEPRWAKQQTDNELRPQPTKMNSFKSGPS